MLQATSRSDGNIVGSVRPCTFLSTLSAERAAVVAFLILMSATLAAILLMTEGHFTYSLDDPYIHITMADRIRSGHYGINAGEVTAPSSSVIWPFFLLPAAGTRLDLYFPLVLNALIGAATAWQLGRYATCLPLPTDWGHAGRLAIAVTLVLALNLVGLAYTGLEHSLQLLIAVTVALVLIEHARGGTLPGWALALAALGPAVRYEMLAITAAVLLVLLLERRWRTLLIVGAGSLLLPGLLAAYLVSHGAYPLPNSVMVKLMPPAMLDATGTNDVPSITTTLMQGLLSFLKTHLAAKSLLVATVAILIWRARAATGRWKVVLAAGAMAGLLHLAVGQFGWFYRYEVYAIAFCGLIALYVLAEREPRHVVWALAWAAAAYAPTVLLTPYGALNVYEQHYQMHRFVTEHYRKPFAVNDLGWVSIGLQPGTYVLDIWGLASNEAARRPYKSSAWLDDVTRRHGAGLVMSYDYVFQHIPAAWQKVGVMELGSWRVSAAGDKLVFYATAVGDGAEIRSNLEAFRQTLPAGAKLTIH